MNYSELEDPQTGEFDGGARPIACHSCLEMLRLSQARPGLLDDLQNSVEVNVQQFPGVPGRDVKKGGVFKKSRKSSTNIHTADAPPVAVTDSVVKTAHSELSSAGRPRRSTSRALPARTR